MNECMHQSYFLGKYFMKWKKKYIMNKHNNINNSIQVYLYNAFHNANHWKAALQKM